MTYEHKTGNNGINLKNLSQFNAVFIVSHVFFVISFLMHVSVQNFQSKQPILIAQKNLPLESLVLVEEWEN